MDVKDPRGQYLSLISIDDSHVLLSPPIVFLFGGSMEDPASTVRRALYDHILAKHPTLSGSLVMPEEFKDWLHDAVYPDLLTFESDLAQTSSLVIIALESPGSIAELGCFAANSSLRRKTLIIMSEHHHNQQSFIKLGPLRQLDDANVYSYPYCHKEPVKTIGGYLDDIVDGIEVYLEKGNKTEAFNVESTGHIALLIFEMLSLYQALILKEIKEFLSILGCNIDQKEIKRLLFLLDKLSLIKKERIGNRDYYLPARQESRVSFSSKFKEKLFDKNAAMMGAAQYYAYNPEERIRRKVISRARGG